LLEDGTIQETQHMAALSTSGEIEPRRKRLTKLGQCCEIHFRYCLKKIWWTQFFTRD
jgi:hypothetical protein